MATPNDERRDKSLALRYESLAESARKAAARAVERLNGAVKLDQRTPQEATPPSPRHSGVDVG